MKICNRCLMDESADNIIFFEFGCNYCEQIKQNYTKPLYASFEKLIDKVALDGKKSSFDVIVGVSGGVDSSYVLKLCKENNLRALAVHMDNSWNSSNATTNIEKVVSAYAQDFHVEVLNWNEYRQMQRAFFNAHVVDIELLYDNAALGSVQKFARKYKIKHVFTGVNSNTEGMRMPESWAWYKYDSLNIKSICKASGVSYNDFPFANSWDRVKNKYNIIQTNILDYINYEKNKVLTELCKQINYTKYVGKHEESTFTKFYQDIILPHKFGIDKRKLHYSDLIMNSEICRNDALQIINKDSETLEKFLTDDRFILNKLKFTQNDFIKYLSMKRSEHYNYNNEYKYIKKIKALKFWKQ